MFTVIYSKQHKCTSSTEWINKLWDTYTMEYYSTIKGNKLPTTQHR